MENIMKPEPHKIIHVLRQTAAEFTIRVAPLSSFRRHIFCKVCSRKRLRFYSKLRLHPLM